MTFAPEPSDDELAAPRDPASYGRPKPLMGPSFWALMGLCVFCVIAGAAVTWLGPKLFAAKPAAPAAAVQSPPAASDLPADPTGMPATPPAASAGPEIAALQARVQHLEAAQTRTVDAAAGALAAASLTEMSQTSRPFAGELASLERVLPLSADLRDLRRLAETGAPTRAALSVSFDAAAAKAATAAREPAENAGFLARALHALSTIVVIRKVDSPNGAGPDATLARAERQVGAGDVEGALKSLTTLPPQAKEAMADWRARAETRVEIDRRVAAVRQAALSDLMANAGRR